MNFRSATGQGSFVIPFFITCGYLLALVTTLWLLDFGLGLESFNREMGKVVGEDSGAGYFSQACVIVSAVVVGTFIVATTHLVAFIAAQMSDAPPRSEDFSSLADTKFSWEK